MLSVLYLAVAATRHCIMMTPKLSGWNQRPLIISQALWAVELGGARLGAPGPGAPGAAGQLSAGAAAPPGAPRRASLSKLPHVVVGRSLFLAGC